MDEAPRARAGARPAAGRLRGARRLVAARPGGGGRRGRRRRGAVPDVGGAGGGARALREGPRLHAPRAHARHRAPARCIVGLPDGRATSRPRRASARPTTSAPSSTRRTRAGLGVLLDWAPAHFPKDAHGLRTSTARTSTSTPTRARASTPTGARPSSTTAGRRWRSFLVASALYWLEEFHVDGLRVDARRLDALPRLLAQGRRVGAEPLRRAREPRGGRVPAALQRPRARALPGRARRAPRSRRRGPA